MLSYFQSQTKTIHRTNLEDIPETKDDRVAGIDICCVQGVIHHHMEHHMDICQIGMSSDVEISSF